MCKKHKNGENGKRRTNGTGTLEKRGDYWRARYFVIVDGVKIRKVERITPDLVQRAIVWNAERNPNAARYYPASFTAEPLPLDAARLALAYLSGGNGVFTREAQLKSQIAELEGVKAERAELERQQAIERAKAEAEADQRRALPVAGAFKFYIESDKRPQSEERTLDGYRAQYDYFTQWVAANYPKAEKLRDITPDIASAFLASLRKVRSNNTHNKYLIFLRLFWRVLRWHKDALLTIDPWEGIRTLAKNDEVVHKELTVDELKRVAAMADTDLRPLFILGIYTGLRLGDCCTLEWGCIDLARGFIDTAPNKTKKYKRKVIIPIHPVLRAALEAVPPASRKGYLLPDLADTYLNLDPARITKRIQAVFKAAGINTGSKGARLYLKRGAQYSSYRIQFDEIGKDGKHIVFDTGTADIDKARKIFAEKVGTAQRARAVVGFHSLRHTFASIMLNAGASQARVEKMLGHSSDSMTMHYYHENASGLANDISLLPCIDETKTAIVAKAEKTPVQPTAANRQPNTPTGAGNAPEGILGALRALLDQMNASQRAEAARIFAEYTTENA